MISSFVIAMGFFFARRGGLEISDHRVLLYSVAGTTFVWVAVTLLTPPTERETLLAFYRKVRPAGPGWDSVRRETGLGPSADSLPQAFLGWTLGCFFVYGALFTTGNLLYGRMLPTGVCGAITVASGWGLFHVLSGILRAPSTEE